MHMQVKYGLAGTGPVVHVQAKIFQPLLPGYLAGHQQQVAQQRLILCFCIGQLGNRFLGDHQEVGGRLGIDIPESQTLVVFENDIGGNLPVSAMVGNAPDRQE